jgi:hypothetical protein
MAAIGPPPETERDAFYCQAPYGLSINASTGFASEVADDVPAIHAGIAVTDVTLYVAEWLAPWVDPSGLELNVYSGGCPPAQVPDEHFEFSWDDVDATLYMEYPPTQLTVYEATVHLSHAVILQSETSIGARVAMSWGQDPPFCGFASTPLDEIHGCGEMYWEAPYNTPPAPRWTTVSTVVGYSFDLAYCLGSATTSVAERDSPIDHDQTWGRIKRLYH